MIPHAHLIGWYYRRNGDHVGPLSPANVADLLSSGELQPTDMLVQIAPAPAGSDNRASYDYREAAAVAADSSSVEGSAMSYS
jgi:hypothetical protein